MTTYSAADVIKMQSADTYDDASLLKALQIQYTSPPVARQFTYGHLQQQLQQQQRKGYYAAIFFLLVSFLGIPFIAPACRSTYILLKEYAYLMNDHQKRTITMYYNMSVALLCFYGVCFLSGVLFNRISSEFLQYIMVFVVFLTLVLSIVFPALCLRATGISSFLDIEYKIATIRQKNQTLISYAIVYNLVVLVIFSMVLLIVLFIDCVLVPFRIVPFGILSLNHLGIFFFQLLQGFIELLSDIVG